MPVIIVLSSVMAALVIIRFSIGKLIVPDKLSIGQATYMGKRQINADVFDWSVYNDETMLVIADGIGSGTKGRTAAQAAVDSIVRTYQVAGATANPAYYFKQAYHFANEAVLKYIPDSTAGANVLCAVIKEGRLYYALAGNCRISVYRKGQLIALSDGQTLDVLAKKAFYRHQLQRAEAQMAYKERQVYNYVGRDDFQELEMFDVPVILNPGDIVVMATDGVYDFCTPRDLEYILDSNASPDSIAMDIINMLDQNDHPQQDNATVIVAHVNKV